MLNNIKRTADHATRRVTLQELSELLSISTEDTLACSFQNLGAQVLACRCLANLMEAWPGGAHTVVYHGAIPVLCSKLIEISYIDLAEQTLSVSGILLLVERDVV